MGWASVPLLRSTGDFKTVTANWGSTAHTRTQTDALGRVTQVTAPNGQVTKTFHDNRRQRIQQVGRNGDPNKWLQWVVYDGLGNPREIYNRNASGNTVLAGTLLEHDVMGNLVHVDHNAFSSDVDLTYDRLGRKTAMDDPDLGNWSYAYDRAGNLIRQTDARGKTTCLYYDSKGRLANKTFRNDTNCSQSTGYDVAYSYDQSHSGSNRSKGQLTKIEYTNGDYAKSLSYNGDGLLARETVSIRNAPSSSYVAQYGYDAFLQPTTVTYPDGEVVTTQTNGMGLPVRLTSNSQGVLVDGNATGTAISNSVDYDYAGRLVDMRLPKSSPDLWRSQSYHGWNTNHPNGNGLLHQIRVGTSSTSVNRLHLTYEYDSFANIKILKERFNNGSTVTNSFLYDEVNRVTNAFIRNYAWTGQGKMTSFEGKSITNDVTHVHAVNKVSNVDRYDYDANGNMIRRNKGLSSVQHLIWDAENRLEGVFGGVSEQYEYDPNGQRVMKISGNKATYYINRFYEVETDLTPLSITLDYFLAEAEGEQRHFVWRTATESNATLFGGRQRRAVPLASTSCKMATRVWNNSTST